MGTATASQYRGRLAPSPTGLLHAGHALTFWTAYERAHAAGGVLIYREDDLDGPRCKPEFSIAAIEDLHWLGITWTEGPDIGGPYGPYRQSERMELYRAAFERLRTAGLVYPCTCSRREIAMALSAPHQGSEEPLYPGTCRACRADRPRNGVNWRFRVPDGEAVVFTDGCDGPQRAIAGKDFGDVLIWRKDDFPSYQLACVVDDALMRITEVVRGADLITSTYRQLLLYRALDWEAPGFFHCPLVRDEQGERLAKRHDAESIRKLREMGKSPAEILNSVRHSPGGVV